MGVRLDLVVLDHSSDREARLRALQGRVAVREASTVSEAADLVAAEAPAFVWIDAVVDRFDEGLAALSASVPVALGGAAGPPAAWTPWRRLTPVPDPEGWALWVEEAVRGQALRRERDAARAASFGPDARSRLHHSERLAAVGQLAAGVAHEVNNPSAFVSANLCTLNEHLARLAEEGPPLPPELDALLQDSRDIVRENLEGMGRIASIVRDLKNFSRIERESVEHVHPNQIINAACNLVYNQIRHRAQLVKDLGDLPELALDRTKLTQVVMNLLINAAQAIPDGGSTEHWIKVASYRRNEDVVLEVTDTGRGIPEHVRDRIFEPFFTTKAKERGTGLGLALCADIVRQHGGRIEVSSELERGTTMRVVLPPNTGLQPGPGRTDRDESADLPVGEERARVLLVDDETMLLRAYRRALKRSHDVVLAESGEEALDILAVDRSFDVIVCDLMMPRIDGIQVYEQIERHAPELLPRILFCSGGAFTPRARAFCAQDHIVLLEKPIDPVRLGQAIQRHHERLLTESPSADVPDDLPPFEEDEDPTRSLL
jgi:signal transduction histidine kinase/CheY-like chemotaxis protein